MNAEVVEAKEEKNKCEGGGGGGGGGGAGVQPGGRWRLMRDCSLGMRFHKKL